MLTGISGKVLVQKAGEDEWSTYDQTTLGSGDQIRTGPNSKVVIELDGATMSLGPDSLFTLDFDKGIFELLIGKIRASIEAWFRGGFVVNSPTAVVAVRGTEFTMQVDEDGTTTVVVLEGIVEVRHLASDSIFLLEPFEMITVPKIPVALEVTRVAPELIDTWWEEELPTTSTPAVPANGGIPPGLILFIVVIVVIASVSGLLLMRRHRRRRVKETSAEWLEALKIRLAKGEITQEQYEELKKRLKET